ncbi:MAG: hypothetical protein IJ524_02990 [Bacteroidales bacterium]|nr:hypothetical protein [Bacteroidales bacterium]
MEGCRLCPRACGVERTGARGFCGAGEGLEVGTVCVHRGEEPPLNPIVNVFFAHCNLQCIYCQNWQISKRAVSGERRVESVDALADRICSLFSTLHSPLASPMLGLVTAAHYADRLPALLDAVRRRGCSPTVVYNSSGYESVDTLRSLEGLVDVYLPDFKYMDATLAAAYSHAADYPAVAQAALREMRRQVGAGLKTDEAGRAYRGLIVRHLVLPGAVENSLRCLKWLADEFPFGLHLSLMAQYFPPQPGLPAPLDRTVSTEEYATVVARAEALGLTDGWTQELEARDNYRPDFDNTDNPFDTGL